MSDEGERVCPLCTEEMDLTDQHLRPCKCGYEICVWCWNHIMDMAEKDETEGRCPACRTPYDKEKIVGATINCESLAGTTSERKQKLRKSKSKALDGRKNLSNVRVIQRNLVYVVGIPPNLADEQILERKEYFGQYGKVLKVSISRTSAGVPHTTNNAFSAYITYTREDEASRCIQAVNGFLLEGKTLRAHYGTTKYCHAWLKNMPCGNPDCLYLHDIGTQEDSFTKDEVISPCIRTKVQQATGVSNNLQRRAGNVLPPPLEEYCNGRISISAKALPKTTTCNPLNQITSPPNGNPIRSSALPAAASWGLRATNGRVTSSNSGSQGSSTHTQGSCDAFSPSPPKTIVLASSSASVAFEEPSNLVGVCSSWENLPWSSETDSAATASSTVDVPREVSSDSAATASSSQELSDISSPDIGNHGCIKSSVGHEDIDSHACRSNLNGAADGASCVDNALPDISTVPSSSSSSVHLSCGQASNLEGCNSDDDKHPTHESQIPADSLHIIANHEAGLTVYQHLKKVNEMPEQVTVPRHTNSCVDWDLPAALSDSIKDKVSLSDELQGIQHLETAEPARTINSFSSFTISDQPMPLSNGNATGVNSWYVTSSKAVGDEHHLNGVQNHEHNFPLLSCPTSNHVVQDYSKKFTASLDTCGTSFDHFDRGGVGGASSYKRPVDIFSVDGNEALAINGESNIISDILSMDLDELDGPLCSAEGVSKILFNDKGFSNNSAPRKTLNSNQSRFSFARQEDSVDQTRDNGTDSSFMENSFSVLGTGEVREGNVLNQANSFPVSTLRSSNSSTSHHAFMSANKTSLRSPISAPPGFVVPARPPPPGFSLVDRVDPPGYSSQNILERAFNISSRPQQMDTGSLPKNLFHVPASVDSQASLDVEFIDPAIMAVGKGKRSVEFHHSVFNSMPPLSMQSGPFDMDPRIQFLSRRPLSPRQNLGFSDPIRNGNLPHTMDSLNTNLSMYAPALHQQSARVSQFGNSQQEGWSGILQGSGGINLLEMAKNGRFASDDPYTAYDVLRFRSTTSNDVFHRAFEK